VFSPLPDLAQTPQRTDLTPEGVERNFLQLRSLLNQYVMKERDKGVRLRLDYDEEEEVSLSPGPPPPLTTTYGRRPSPRNSNAGPSNTFTASRYEARSSPTAFPLFTTQAATTGAPLGHEVTLDQLLQSPIASVPPPAATSWEQAMASLPMARNASMSVPMATSNVTTTESLQGFNLMPYMISQMMANFPWQQLISQAIAAQQGNPGGVTNNKVEHTVNQPYKPNSLSCFSPEIADYDFPNKLKMPTHIRTYDGTDDPEDHLQIFSGAARIEKWGDPECCLMFMQTLVGSARILFNGLPAGSIHTFNELGKGFLANFSQQRRCVKDATVIFQIKQKDDESLKSFIERYKKEGLTYVGADEKMKVAGFMNAINSKYLTREFNKSLPRTLEEALEIAGAHIRGEEAVDIKEQKTQRV